MQAFGDAAALLQKRPLSTESEASARELLTRLGFDPALLGGETSGAQGIAYTAALLRTAERMPRIFSLGAPDAPGLTFVGGTVEPKAYGVATSAFDTAHVGGRGLHFVEAFKGCVGEGAEYLSQLEWGDETLKQQNGTDSWSGMGSETIAAFAAMLDAGSSAPEMTEGIAARSLTTGSEAIVPADFTLRRRRGRDGQKYKVSTAGCGAGETLTQATIHGLLELVERDAAALWWVGGRRGRAIAEEAMQAGDVAALIGELRRDNATGRMTWLLDISSDLDVPCVAALSTNADGEDFACGLAAHVTLTAAARAAIQELCQMELAHRLTVLKLEQRGESALNATDRRHLRRMKGINAARCPLLFAAGPPRAFLVPASIDLEGQLRWAVAQLARQGAESFVVDLTRAAIGIPSVRVLAPKMQGMPTHVQTARLQQAVADTGGGHLYTNGIDLL